VDLERADRRRDATTAGHEYEFQDDPAGHEGDADQPGDDNREAPQPPRPTPGKRRSEPGTQQQEQRRPPKTHREKQRRAPSGEINTGRRGQPDVAAHGPVHMQGREGDAPRACGVRAPPLQRRTAHAPVN